MKQGASRHALADRGDDLYETPAICTEAALRAGIFGDMPQVIWDPCAGRGAMSRVLRAAGFTVITTDLVAYDGADAGIASGIDFLMERAAPDGCGGIIMNPPYKLADAFIRHALSLVPRVAVLLRAMAIEGAGRADLIDGHLTDFWIGIDRPPAMHREGWTGNRLGNSGAPFAWFVFQAEPRGAEPIRMRRFWWDEGKRGRGGSSSPKGGSPHNMARPASP
jgi:hypothetical protein